MKDCAGMIVMCMQWCIAVLLCMCCSWPNCTLMKLNIVIVLDIVLVHSLHRKEHFFETERPDYNNGPGIIHSLAPWLHERLSTN